MEKELDLERDCVHGMALCCLASSFKKSEYYAFSKNPGEPCQHLQNNFRCAIHTDLTDMGMEGCALYTCFGAGQNVSQHLFPGTDWRNSPEIAQDISSKFYKLKELFELI